MFSILSRHNFAESIFTCNLFSSEAVKWQTFPGFLLTPESLDWIDTELFDFSIDENLSKVPEGKASHLLGAKEDNVD